MKTVPLGELCDISIGRTPPRKEPDLWGQGSPWLSIADMNQGKVIRHTKEQITAAGSSKGRVVRPGTVLLSFKLSIGKVARAGMPLFTNEAIAALPILDEGVLDPQYLMRALESMDLASGSNRAAMGGTLNKAKLSQVAVPVPRLDEQRRIAEILDHADGLRSRRRQMLAHLDHLTQSIFHEMFAMERQKPLGDICSFYSGGTPNRRNPDYWKGDLAWFSAKDIKKPELFDSIDHISRNAPVETGLRVLPSGTVVLVVRGMILAHSVPVSVLRVPGAVNQDIKALVPLGNHNSEFISGAVRYRSEWLLARASSSAHGTRKIDTSWLAVMPVPDAAEGRCDEFEDRVAHYRERERAARRALALADDLFTSLQARAFAGEL